jgi:hypothetical protein
MMWIAVVVVAVLAQPVFAQGEGEGEPVGEGEGEPVGEGEGEPVGEGEGEPVGEGEGEPVGEGEGEPVGEGEGEPVGEGEGEPPPDLCLSYPTVGGTCRAGIGVCERVGYLQCFNVLGPPGCDAVAGPPSRPRDDIDNELDDDCDGQVDEDAGGVEGEGELPVPLSCTPGCVDDLTLQLCTASGQPTLYACPIEERCEAADCVPAPQPPQGCPSSSMVMLPFVLAFRRRRKS